MRQWILRLLLFSLKPLRYCADRWLLIEWLIDAELTPREADSVRLACESSGKSLGAYYYWKISQIAQVMAIKKIESSSALRIILDSDETDYTPIHELAHDPRGILVAIPHHGLFVSSIIALIEKIKQQTHIFVFYDPPDVHATNEIFDVLYRRLYTNPSSGVTILHNNRSGIATALNELKHGALVIIMPDVYKNPDDTFRIPFCGGSRNVMLGTASLARRTQAVIIPMVSDPSDNGIGFKTRFGSLIETKQTSKKSNEISPAVALYEDYRTTATLFGQFEQLMNQRMIYWQYCRTHFLGDPAPSKLKAQELAQLSELLPKDPRVLVTLNDPLVIE